MNLTPQNSNSSTLFEYIHAEVKSRSLKLTEIERNTNISYSTINRTFNGSRDFTALEMAQVMNFLFTKEQAVDLVKTYSPSNTSLLNLVNDTQSETSFNQSQEKYFTEHKTFSIANLIELGYFKKTNQIHEIFGLTGMKILNDMAKDKIISVNSTGDIKSNFKRSKPSFDTIRKQISLATEYHKDSNCGKMKNFIYFGTKLLSKEKRTFLHTATRLFKEIVSSFLHEGEIAESKVKMLTNHLKTSSKCTETSETEPVFYSILMDDFKSVETTEGALQ